MRRSRSGSRQRSSALIRDRKGELTRLHRFFFENFETYRTEARADAPSPTARNAERRMSSQRYALLNETPRLTCDGMPFRVPTLRTMRRRTQWTLFERPDGNVFKAVKTRHARYIAVRAKRHLRFSMSVHSPSVWGGIPHRVPRTIPRTVLWTVSHPERLLHPVAVPSLLLRHER
jgi:hypothetical protein